MTTKKEQAEKTNEERQTEDTKHKNESAPEKKKKKKFLSLCFVLFSVLPLVFRFKSFVILF